MPWKDGGDAAVQLDDLGHDAVQKIAVVGNDDDRPGVVHQIGFQPCDGFHVQVVGRLVQKDDIRFGEQELTEGDARFLTA